MRKLCILYKDGSSEWFYVDTFYVSSLYITVVYGGVYGGNPLTKVIPIDYIDELNFFNEDDLD